MGNGFVVVLGEVLDVWGFWVGFWMCGVFRLVLVL